MNVVPYSSEIKDYLSVSSIVDFEREEIRALSHQLSDVSRDLFRKIPFVSGVIALSIHTNGILLSKVDSG